MTARPGSVARPAGLLVPLALALACAAYIAAWPPSLAPRATSIAPTAPTAPTAPGSRVPPAGAPGIEGWTRDDDPPGPLHARLELPEELVVPADARAFHAVLDGPSPARYVLQVESVDDPSWLMLASLRIPASVVDGSTVRVDALHEGRYAVSVRELATDRRLSPTLLVRVRFGPRRAPPPRIRVGLPRE